MLRICCRKAVLHARAKPVAVSTCSQICSPWIGQSFHLSTTDAQRNSTPLRKELKDAAKARHNAQQTQGNAVVAKAGTDITGWELTVGIEIHAQLNTARKLFSGASTNTTDEPNEQVAPFDLAVPGSLPLLQKANLIPALRAAIALNCDIQPVSHFDRKHYFYHDQPAGYQITQYYRPFAKDGSITITTDDCAALGDEEKVVVGIKQIQMEQDTAKTQEQDEQTGLIDYNRSGHPLIEIISLPHIHSPEMAAAYVRKIQATLLSVDAVTTGMESGGLRADVNVSVRRRDAVAGPHSYSGVAGLGQRTEIKNLSTLKGIEDAIKAERDRQIDVLKAGGRIEGETRGWSATQPGQTRRLRRKEGEVDYRYMPDPDIPLLRLDASVADHLRAELPMLPDEQLLQLTDPEAYGLSKNDAKILLSLDSGERLDYFHEVVKYMAAFEVQTQAKEEAHICILPESSRTAANWVLHELGSLLSTTDVPWSKNRVTAAQMAQIITQAISGHITGTSAKSILRLIFEGDRRSVPRVIEQDGLAFKPLSDTEYEHLARSVMEQHPSVVQDIKEKGKHGKIMFLVGQIMRQGEDGRVEAKKAEMFVKQALAVN